MRLPNIAINPVIKRFVKVFISVFVGTFATNFLGMAPSMDVYQRLAVAFVPALLMALEKSFQQNF